MDTNKHSPLPSNLVLTANISMELLDKDGNVLDAQYGHNRVINDGLEWFIKRAFSGMTDGGSDAAGDTIFTSPGGVMDIDEYAIILGTGSNGDFYIPATTERVLRQQADGLVVIKREDASNMLSASYDEALQQISFVGQLELTAAGQVRFIKEMALGVVEVDGQQLIDGTNYRLINIASNPPNRDYTALSSGHVRASIIFRLFSAS